MEPSAKGRQLDLSRSVGKPHYSNHRARPTPNLGEAKTAHSNVQPCVHVRMSISTIASISSIQWDTVLEYMWSKTLLSWKGKILLPTSSKVGLKRMKYFQIPLFLISGKIWQGFSLMVNQREVEVVYSPLQFINNQRDERNGKYILEDVRNTFLSSSIGHDHTKGVISAYIQHRRWSRNHSDVRGIHSSQIVFLKSIEPIAV